MTAKCCWLEKYPQSILCVHPSTPASMTSKLKRAARVTTFDSSLAASSLYWLQSAAGMIWPYCSLQRGDETCWCIGQARSMSEHVLLPVQHQIGGVVRGNSPSDAASNAGCRCAQLLVSFSAGQ